MGFGFANSDSNDCTKLNTIILSWYIRQNSGRRTKWIVSPYHKKLKRGAGALSEILSEK
jgi:hypothetical protein